MLGGEGDRFFHQEAVAGLGSHFVGMGIGRQADHGQVEVRFYKQIVVVGENSRLTAALLLRKFCGAGREDVAEGDQLDLFGQRNEVFGVRVGEAATTEDGGTKFFHG